MTNEMPDKQLMFIEKLMKLMKEYTIDELTVDAIHIVKKKHIIEQKSQADERKEAIRSIFGDNVPAWANEVAVEDLLKDPFGAK
jgi:hypothetical protein